MCFQTVRLFRAQCIIGILRWGREILLPMYFFSYTLQRGSHLQPGCSCSVSFRRHCDPRWAVRAGHSSRAWSSGAGPPCHRQWPTWGKRAIEAGERRELRKAPAAVGKVRGGLRIKHVCPLLACSPQMQTCHLTAPRGSGRSASAAQIQPFSASITVPQDMARTCFWWVLSSLALGTFPDPLHP